RALIWTAIAGSRFEHVPQGLHHLIGCRTPSLCLSIDLFERMNDISIVQSHIGLAQCSAVASIEGSVPLFILVAETHYHHVALLNRGSRANSVHRGGLVITPELTFVLAQAVASSVARRVTSYRRGKAPVQPRRFGTALDLLTPIGVDFAGKIDRKTH